MISVKLIEFIKTGIFGVIYLGQNRSDVEKLMRLKSDFFDKNEYWDNKNIELKFSSNELVLITFFLNHEGLEYEKESFNDFFICLDLNELNISVSDFRKLITSKKIILEKEYSISNEISFHLKNDIYISFTDDKLNSISAMNIGKL